MARGVEHLDSGHYSYCTAAPGSSLISVNDAERITLPFITIRNRRQLFAPLMRCLPHLASSEPWRT